MKRFVTQLKALDANTGEMKTWAGPYVNAPSQELAQKWCDDNAGYLEVLGELVMEIPCKEAEDGYLFEPDWGNAIDYENINNN